MTQSIPSSLGTPGFNVGFGSVSGAALHFIAFYMRLIEIVSMTYGHV